MDIAKVLLSECSNVGPECVLLKKKSFSILFTFNNLDQYNKTFTDRGKENYKH